MQWNLVKAPKKSLYCWLFKVNDAKTLALDYKLQMKMARLASGRKYTFKQNLADHPT